MALMGPGLGRSDQGAGEAEVMEAGGDESLAQGTCGEAGWSF